VADAFEKTAVLVMAPLVFAFMAVTGMSYLTAKEVAETVRHNACLDRQGWDLVLNHIQADREFGRADREGRNDRFGSIGRRQQASDTHPACS
jgi:hypothetical protein